MNILILNYEYPPLGGGAGIVTKHLAEEFAANGHKVVVVTTWFFGEPEYYTDHHLTVVRLKSKRRNTYESNPREMYSWIRHAKKYFREHADEVTYDICLANFTLPGGEVALYLKKKFNIQYVILSHGHDIPWAYPRRMFFWHLFFYKWIRKICLEAEKNIVLSSELKQVADKFLGEKHVSKNISVSNGLYMHHFNKRFEGETLKIVFVGRLVSQKAPILFLEVMQQVQDAGLPYEVQILGDGELKAKMQEYVTRNNIDHISFKGKISHAEVLEILGNSHLLVSTSESEGMSMAILEAISSGIYVIATDVSGNTHMIVEDVNGNIVARNAGMIADKIISFYNDKLRKNYTFPPDYVSLMHDRFSWDKIARQYEDIFLEILK